MNFRVASKWLRIKLVSATDAGLKLVRAEMHRKLFKRLGCLLRKVIIFFGKLATIKGGKGGKREENVINVTISRVLPMKPNHSGDQ